MSTSPARGSAIFLRLQQKLATDVDVLQRKMDRWKAEHGACRTAPLPVLRLIHTECAQMFTCVDTDDNEPSFKPGQGLKYFHDCLINPSLNVRFDDSGVHFRIRCDVDNLSQFHPDIESYLLQLVYWMNTARAQDQCLSVPLPLQALAIVTEMPLVDSAQETSSRTNFFWRYTTELCSTRNSDRLICVRNPSLVKGGSDTEAAAFFDHMTIGYNPFQLWPALPFHFGKKYDGVVGHLFQGWNRTMVEVDSSYVFWFLCHSKYDSFRVVTLFLCLEEVIFYELPSLVKLGEFMYGP
jgi:hypothetical protein